MHTHTDILLFHHLGFTVGAFYSARCLCTSATRTSKTPWVSSIWEIPVSRRSPFLRWSNIFTKRKNYDHQPKNHDMIGAGGAYFRLRLRLSGVISNGGGKKLFGDNLFKFSQIWQALKIHGQWSTAIELRRSIERNINSPLSGPNFIVIRNLKTSFRNMTWRNVWETITEYQFDL